MANIENIENIENIANIKNIIISTTAINRPVLHKDIFPGWLKWISMLDKQIGIKWYINIDMVDQLSFTYEETQESICQILSDLKLDERIDVSFLKSSEKGNFFNACKRLSTNIIQYVFCEKLDPDKIRIMWLEDDWKFNDNIINLFNINYLLETFSKKKTFINFTFIRNNYIWALAPSLIDYSLWVDIFYKAWSIQKTNMDPEHCAGLYYIKMYGKEKDISNLTIICNYVHRRYLQRPCINYVNSLFTVLDEEKNKLLMNNGKFVKKDKFKEITGNKNIFIRITPTFCSDYGRDFMTQYNLKKNKGNEINGQYVINNLS